MKKIKLYCIIVLMLFFSLTLTACEPFVGFDDDQAIIKCNSFSTVGSYTKKTNSSYIFNCSKANGVQKIKNITVPDNPVFSITLKIESGRFKVVLVKDNKVYVVCDSDVESDVATDFEAGKYNLRIVAEDAKVDFKFIFNSYN